MAIRARIKTETELNASAGISYNKFLAKLASDHRKPTASTSFLQRWGPAFVETLPVGKFHGIGPATVARFDALGIQTGLDIRGQTLAFLEAHFGKAGAYYYWISRGIDERPVQANRIRKSVGAENTFFSDLTKFDTLVAELQPLVDIRHERSVVTGIYIGPQAPASFQQAGDLERVAESRSPRRFTVHAGELFAVLG